ncbi:ABC transporter permease [Blastococcus sp. SYSU D00820]
MSTSSAPAGTAAPAPGRSVEPGATPADAPARGTGSRSSWGSLLAFKRISGVYVFLVMGLVFSLTIPDLFLTQTTWLTLANEQAVTTILAIGLTFALSSGVFDLSIGAILGCSAAVVAFLHVHAGWDVWTACAVAVLFGAVVGCLNALVVVTFKVDSFIATLGVQAILFAVLLRVTEGQQIIGLPIEFLDIGTTRVAGVPLPFVVMLVLALVAWYVMDLTPLGRYIEATGGNRDAARLAGVRTSRLTWFCFVVSGAVAAVGGIILLTRVSAAGPTTGTEYVLPVFAAAFLGRTQFRPGRFNIWGTVLAVYLLAMITKGLQLWGQEPWVTQLFYGVVLVVAVSLSGLERRQRARRTTAAPPPGAADAVPATAAADAIAPGSAAPGSAAPGSAAPAPAGAPAPRTVPDPEGEHDR